MTIPSSHKSLSSLSGHQSVCFTLAFKMKKYTPILISLLFAPISFAEDNKPSNVEVPSQVSYANIAEELFSEIMSPGDIILTIKDFDSLEEAKKSLKSHQDKINSLADSLKAIPVPDKSEVQALYERMSKKDKNLEKEKSKQINQHLQNMSPELRNQWMTSMQAFYKNLDSHKELFDRYLSPPQEN